MFRVSKFSEIWAKWGRSKVFVYPSSQNSFSAAKYTFAAFEVVAATFFTKLFGRGLGPGPGHTLNIISFLWAKYESNYLLGEVPESSKHTPCLGESSP